MNLYLMDRVTCKLFLIYLDGLTIETLNVVAQYVKTSSKANSSEDVL